MAYPLSPYQEWYINVNIVRGFRLEPDVDATSYFTSWQSWQPTDTTKDGPDVLIRSRNEDGLEDDAVDERLAVREVVRPLELHGPGALYTGYRYSNAKTR